MAVKVRQPKGMWWLFLDSYGKRKTKRVGSSKRAAKMAAEEIQAKIAVKKFTSGLLAQGKSQKYVVLLLLALSAMFHHEIEDSHLAVRSTLRVLHHVHTDPPQKNNFFTKYIKKQMGHHSGKITVDTYGYLMPGGNKAAVDKLGRLETATICNPDIPVSGNLVFRQTGSLRRERRSLPQAAL